MILMLTLSFPADYTSVQPKHCSQTRMSKEIHDTVLNVSVSSCCVQMQFIDALNGEDLLLTGEVKWRPLVEENAQSILKVVTPTYNDAGL